MPRPFIVRVESDDATLAECIARALEASLTARDASAHVVRRGRALPGASITIAIWEASQGARWLAPIDVPAEPLAAADHVMRFLEQWGFIAGSRVKAWPGRS